MNRDELIQRITEAGFPYSSDMLAKLDCFERLLNSEREAIIDLVAFYGGSVEIEAAIRAREES